MNKTLAFLTVSVLSSLTIYAQEPSGPPSNYSNRLDDHFPQEFVKAYDAWNSVTVASLRVPSVVDRLKQGDVDADTRRVDTNRLIALANHIIVLEKNLPELERFKDFHRAPANYLATLEKELGKETVASLPVILAKGDPQQVLKIAEALRLASATTFGAEQQSR